jgi:hypothetical protein
MTALRTVLNMIEFQVSAAVGGKLVALVGLASAAAAGRSARARRPCAAAITVCLLISNLLLSPV